MTAWLSLALSIVAVAIGVILTRRVIYRRTGSAVIMDNVQREIGAILTEMNQTTERNIELLEDRLTRLQETIDQADRRLITLRRETQKREKAELVYTHLSKIAGSVSGRPGQHESSVEDNSEKSGSGVAADQPPERTASHREDSVRLSGQSTASNPTGDSPRSMDMPILRERVLALYRQGIAIERIASRVEATVSEIELIVSLSEH